MNTRKKIFLSLHFVMLINTLVYGSHQTSAGTFSLFPILFASSVMGVGATLWAYNNHDHKDDDESIAKKEQEYKAIDNLLTEAVEIKSSEKICWDLKKKDCRNQRKNQEIKKKFANIKQKKEHAFAQFKTQLKKATFIDEIDKSDHEPNQIFALGQQIDSDFERASILRLKNSKNFESDGEEDEELKKFLEDDGSKLKEGKQHINTRLITLDAKYRRSLYRHEALHLLKKTHQFGKSVGIGLITLGTFALGSYTFLHWLSQKS